MPTTLPVRGQAIERVDDFPFFTVLIVALLGIALGLWVNVADETALAEAPASFANARDGNPAKAAEPVFALQTPSRLSFGP